MIVNTLLTTLIFIGLFFSGCCTDQAAKVRADRKITLGITGAAVRPTDSLGIVGSASGTLYKDVRMPLEDNAEEKSESNQDNRKTYWLSNKTYYVGIHSYPSTTSAFYYGFGGEYVDRTVRFDTPTNASSLTSVETTEVSFKERIFNVRPSIGWDWIWDGGFSILLDVGVNVTASKTRKVVDDGADGNVNSDVRDNTQSKIDRKLRMLNGASGHLVFGYSF